MKQRVEEMEREAMKLRELQAAAESADGSSGREGSAGAPMEGEDDKAQADSRSIYVGNVCFVYLGYFTYAPSHAKSTPGRLCSHSGRHPGPLSSSWYHQSGYYPL